MNITNQFEIINNNFRPGTKVPISKKYFSDFPNLGFKVNVESR